MAKILIVEDSELLHKMYRRKLRGHDLEIVVAGLKALELLENGQFDAIVSDGDLEDHLTGIDVWLWVETNRPDLLPKFMFCSGNLEVEKFCRQRNIAYHEKGGEPKELFETINKILEANSCSSPATSCSCCPTTSSPSSSRDLSSS